MRGGGGSASQPMTRALLRGPHAAVIGAISVEDGRSTGCSALFIRSFFTRCNSADGNEFDRRRSIKALQV